MGFERHQGRRIAEQRPSSDLLKLDGLGAQLRRFREGMEMPGPQFAKALDIDTSTLSKYELNRRAIPLSLIEKVAKLAKQPTTAVLIWCIRERFPEVGNSPSEVANFLDGALRRLEADMNPAPRHA